MYKPKDGFIRRNNIDEAGWLAVVDGLKSATSIKSLNGVDGLDKIFAGNVEAVLSKRGLREREATVVIMRLLLRSKTKLVKLDLR